MLDLAMLHDAQFSDSHILPTKFYLADAGFTLMSNILVPLEGHHYHLDEWGCGRLSEACNSRSTPDL